MLSPIDRHHHGDIKALHAELIAQFPLINAVVSGLQEGFVFSNDSRRSFLVATKSGFCLLNAEDDGTDMDQLLDFLRSNDTIPRYLHIYRPQRSFQDYLLAHLQQSKLRRRVQFRAHTWRPAFDYRNLLPPGYRVATIQEVGAAKLRVFDLDLGNRYWNSENEFLGRAIGACVLNADDEPAAICYSACVVEGIAEMDTLVLPDYRGRGFMRLVSEPFLNAAIQNQLTAHWDTFVSNTPSFVMAQKLGLQMIQEYALLSVWRNL